MTSRIALLLQTALAITAGAAIAQSAPTPSTAAAETHMPTYVDGKLRLPADYREWIYVTSGMDMSYRRVATPDHHMFDNVFVNPEAYRVFKQTGTWPDKTMMVHGLFQDGDLMGVEVHVKDSARLEGGWAFFAFDDEKPATEIKHSVDCYACHRAHAAVDTTFVQFYPTLLPIARAANTLSASYLEEEKKAN